jgi:hypothetical protein
MAIFFASAVWAGGRIWRALVAVVCCAVFAAATGFALVSMFQTCDEDDEVSGILRDYRTRAGVVGTDEYAPPAADNSAVPMGLPFACLVKSPTLQLGNGDPDMTPEWSPDQGSCDATYSDIGTSALHRRLQAETPHAGFLVLRLRTYPAWRVSVNGQTITAMPERQDGLMAVPVPQGRAELAVDWTTTRDVLIGWVISAAALASITLLWIRLLRLRERRRIRPRLS